MVAPTLLPLSLPRHPSSRASFPCVDAPSDADTAIDFKKELQRRGITSAQTEQLKAKQPAGDAQPGASQPRRRVEPPRWASDTPESLAQSRALGAEGLEGFLPRATQLLRLAFGFWIPFWPFMAVFSALFTLTYVLFGDFFLHSGDYFQPETVLNSGGSVAGQPAKRARGPPAYVVPEALLAEPTFDRMVPFTSDLQARVAPA